MAVVTCLLALAGGCGGGDSRVDVILKGRVTHAGQPVPDARVQVQSPETGAAGAATTDAQGNYQFATPLPPGKYIATVTPVDTAPPAGAAPPTAPPPERTDIPEKYRAPDQSGLSVELKAGENTFDIAMTSG